MTIKEGLPQTTRLPNPVLNTGGGQEGGLPKEAFAIISDPDDPDTWKLPHHKKSILRALQGKLDIEKTVDWDKMGPAVAALSPGGYRGQRVDASPEEVLKAAKHLAGHYLKADKPLPDTLAALV